MNAVWMVVAVVAGGLVALQFGVNSTWRTAVGAAPAWATFVSYAGGLLASVLCLLAARAEPPPLERMAEAPWWAWLGGAVGVGYVTAGIFLAPRLGATTLIVLIIAGQVLASVVFDHFGLVGYPVRPLTASKAAGCVLLVVAVVLVKWA